MRLLLLFFILFQCDRLYSQTLPFDINHLPTDSAVLKLAYGKVDKSKNTYSRKLKEDEIDYAPNKKITYKIVFESPVYLQGKNVLLVIIDAPNSSLDDEQMGYRDIFFFEQKNNGHLMLARSIIATDELPIGDEQVWGEDNADASESLFSIVDIGKDKKALISTFSTSGNQHLEDTKNIDLLELGNLTFLCTIRYRSDNVAYVIQDDSICTAKKDQSDFEIIKSNKEWYDIRVHYTGYGYKKGCAETYVIKKSNILYSYKNGDYFDKKGKNIDITVN